MKFESLDREEPEEEPEEEAGAAGAGAALLLDEEDVACEVTPPSADAPRCNVGAPVCAAGVDAPDPRALDRLAGRPPAVVLLLCARWSGDGSWSGVRPRSIALPSLAYPSVAGPPAPAAAPLVGLCGGSKYSVASVGLSALSPARWLSLRGELEEDVASTVVCCVFRLPGGL